MIIACEEGMEEYDEGLLGRHGAQVIYCESKEEFTEEFLKEAWDWTYLYGNTIQEQQRLLGCSCDWDRKRFTLDEGLSAAVLEQFVKLYEEGLIYKGKRMVNWCPSCHTAISDAEVEYK